MFFMADLARNKPYTVCVINWINLRHRYTKTELQLCLGLEILFRYNKTYHILGYNKSTLKITEIDVFIK